MSDQTPDPAAPDGTLPPELTEEPPAPPMNLEDGVDLDGPSDEAQDGAAPPEERLA